MCGICGYMTPDNTGSFSKEVPLSRMTDLLAHRGPDRGATRQYRGNWGVVGFGHRRLSIIDLSTAGDQPLTNEDGAVSIVFNGEIYNYLSLRRELLQRGHHFHSKSDTEVVVHLYEEMGLGAIDRLEGMFAFALWDKPRRQLLLVRDRFGIKPLYYMLKGQSIFFASEIKALLAADQVERRVDPKALDDYISLGYTTGWRTIFKGIRRLPPATAMIFSEGRAEFHRYWELSYRPGHDISEAEAAIELRRRFQRSVQRHLVADVAVGAFLSGGLDSSIVTAHASRLGVAAFQTFSIGFQKGGDELPFAAAVASRYNTRHREFRVTPDATALLPRLLWHLDEPFFDNSILPTYHVSRLARENVKVVLSGDGGDEVFGGYEWTRRQQAAWLFSHLPKGVRTAAARFISSPLAFAEEYGTTSAARLHRALADLTGNLADGFLRRTSVSMALRRHLYSASLKDRIGDYNGGANRRSLFDAADVCDDRTRMLDTDLKSYLPDDCLFKVDRMSMAHGLEVRVPFLDRELVEFAARLPYGFKIKGLTSKYILKRAFGNLLPPEVKRQRKQGFTIPIADWLRGPLAATARGMLLSDRFREREWFEPSFVAWMLESHRCGAQNFGHRIWSLVVLEAWARLYLDKNTLDVPTVSLMDLL